MKKTVILIALSSILMSCSHSLEKNSWAAYYADLAVSQNEKNINNKCGFSGRRWQSNYYNHYSWATSVSESAAQSEIDGRISQLNSCKK